MTTPGCDQPLPLQVLEDYWFGELPAPEAEQAEEHLFVCDRCGDRLRALVFLGQRVRRLAREGAVSVAVTASFLEVAARAGLRTREHFVAPGGRVACTVTAQDDLMVARMSADFRGVTQVDVLVEAAGQPIQRIAGVPVSSDARELILLRSMPETRALGAVELHVRLVAREGASERVLGDYVFDHTPTLA